jgi:hypothetical protein
MSTKLYLFILTLAKLFLNDRHYTEESINEQKERLNKLTENSESLSKAMEQAVKNIKV